MKRAVIQCLCSVLLLGCGRRPPSTQQLYDQAMQAYLEHDYAGAKENLVRLLSIEPNHEEAMEQLVRVEEKISEGADTAQNFSVPIPHPYDPIAQVSLAVEFRTTENSFKEIHVRLINPTSEPLLFSGYSEQSPWYRIQVQQNSGWTEHEVGWFCGTGLRRCTIPPRMSSVIRVLAHEDLSPMRVGVDFVMGNSKTEETVWSERID